MLDSIRLPGLCVCDARPEEAAKPVNTVSPPKQKWTLTPEAFDRLLAWLDDDRERAGLRYEEIRSLLIKNFRKHGCSAAEELADDTINRVARRLPDFVSTYVGEPARYFFGVAHHVHMEYLRRPESVPLPSRELPGRAVPVQPDLPEEPAPEHLCLRRCMEKLPPRSRELIVQYYHGERQAKIRMRKELAERLGVRLENLRLRAQRIRVSLKRCVVECVGSGMPV